MARPMTMAEKILAAHAGLDEVEPGQLIECNLDLVLSNDITSPIAIKNFKQIGVEKVSIPLRSPWFPTTTSRIRTSKAPSRPNRCAISPVSRASRITTRSAAWASSTRCCPSRASWARAI